MDRQPKLYKEIYQASAHAFKAFEAVYTSKAMRMLWDFLLAFLLAGSQIMPSFTPFALAYAASKSGADRASAYGGAFFGYVLIFGSDGLCYAAAVLICYTAITLFDSVQRTFPPFMPICSAAALLIIKGAIVVSSGFSAIALLFCESALCGIFCFIFIKMCAKDEKSIAMGQMLLLIALLLTVEPLRIFGIISPSRAACCLLAMSFSYYGGSSLGAGAGVSMGAAMDLASRGGPFFAFTYSFSALLSGTVAGAGKLLFTVLYIMAYAASVLWNWGDLRSLSALYECFMASMIFYMLPDSAFTPVIKLVPKAKTYSAVPEINENIMPARLRSLSEAISNLSGSIAGFVSSAIPKNDESISEIYDCAADKVCRSCVMVSHCWTRNYSQTCGAMSRVSNCLSEKHRVEPSDFPLFFSSGCINIRALCGAINEEYSSLMRRNARGEKNASARKIMQEQYESISGVLTNVAVSLDAKPEHFPLLKERVQTLANTYLKRASASVYMNKGRMYVEITSPELTEHMPDIDALCNSLALALDLSFARPETIIVQHGYMLRIAQREKYSAKVNIALRKRGDSEECGDSTSHFSTLDGRAIIMLSDGMGTGHEAAQLSGKALELITQFVKSGCGIADSARAVLPVLAAQFEQCGFVTLDLLEINLFTGMCQLLKYGAAPSFLLKNGIARQFTGTSLPAGLEQLLPCAPRPILFKLCAGDRLIMVSDGICDNLDGTSFGNELTSCRQRGTQLTEKIIDYARLKKSSDDMTAIVIELCDSE